MSLVDVLMGGVVFGLASTASLQLYGSSLQFAQGREQRQVHAQALELALAEGQRRLVELEPQADCAAVAAALEQALKPSLVASPLSQEVRRDNQHNAVRLVIGAPGLLERSRWYVPAAYGLCELAGGPG